MPLRPVLKKDLTVRSSETGTKSDIEEALTLSANGTVFSKIQTIDLLDLNNALDRLKAGNVLGKLVLDLRRSIKPAMTSFGRLPAVLS